MSSDLSSTILSASTCKHISTVLNDTPKYVIVVAGAEAFDLDSAKPISVKRLPSVSKDS